VTRIPFRLARPGGVGLSIFDLRGRRLRELSAGERGAGEAELVWDGRDASGSAMPAGIYFARFRLDGVHAGATRLVRLER